MWDKYLGQRYVWFADVCRLVSAEQQSSRLDDRLIVESQAKLLENAREFGALALKPNGALDNTSKRQLFWLIGNGSDDSRADNDTDTYKFCQWRCQAVVLEQLNSRDLNVMCQAQILHGPSVRAQAE